MHAIAALAFIIAAIVFALLIYPGEFSHVSTKLNRWFYDRGAADYERKWASDAYHSPRHADAIRSFANRVVIESDVKSVLDLGCGTGRGIRILHDALPANTNFVGVDYSVQMLNRFREWIAMQDDDLQRRIDVVDCNLEDWPADNSVEEKFGLVLLLEVGEFVPGFESMLRAAANAVSPGGGLIMTRPAAPWSWVFLRRSQSRRCLRRLMVDCGLQEPEIMPWRSRYELLFTGRVAANANS